MGYSERGLQRTVEAETRDQLILAVKGDQRFHRGKLKAWPSGDQVGRWGCSRQKAA